MICQRVWKTVKCQGKIREKSGNFEVDDKWQLCNGLSMDSLPYRWTNHGYYYFIPPSSVYEIFCAKVFKIWQVWYKVEVEVLHSEIFISLYQQVFIFLKGWMDGLQFYGPFQQCFNYIRMMGG